MATKSELEAKITKAKANKMMPDALKEKYIAGVQKEIDALKPEAAPAAAPKKASKKTMEKAFGKEFMKSKDKGALKTYKASPADRVAKERKTIDSIADQGDMTNSDAQGVFEANDRMFNDMYETYTPVQIAKAMLRLGDEPATKTEKKKAAPKKAEPAKPAGKKGADYDCDELIEKEKARKASSKKSAAKSPAKKSGDAIEKTTDAIEKKAEDGELTKEQILALIQKFKKEIRRLETLLKTAK